MTGGRVTSATTKTTAALLAGSLVDPTLVCLTGALAVAPVAAGGLAYHAAKKGLVKGKKSYAEHKARKEAAREAAAAEAHLDPRLLVEYEACVRRIAGAATGVAIQGSMAAVMPHLSVVVVVNSVDLVAAVKQLRELRRQDVHRAVSGLSMTEHVVVGVVLKMLATGVTLGYGDLCAMDAAAGEHLHFLGRGMSERVFGDRVEAIFGGHDSIGLHVEPAEALTLPVEHSAVQMHQDLLQHHGIHEINAAANFAPDEVERYLGLGDEWRPDEMAGTDRHSGLTNVVTVGTVAAGMDVVITKVLEDPVHTVIDKAQLLRHEHKETFAVGKLVVTKLDQHKPIRRKAVPVTNKEDQKSI